MKTKNKGKKDRHYFRYIFHVKSTVKGNDYQFTITFYPMDVCGSGYQRQVIFVHLIRTSIDFPFSTLYFSIILLSFFIRTCNALPLLRFTSISNVAPNAQMRFKDIVFQPSGSCGVSLKAFSAIGRIPNKPSVIIRQYKALSVDRWRWFPSGHASTA